MVRRTSATARARSSRTFRSLPKTFTPTSERIPVVSMLMRLMMGCVQMLATPGKVAAASSSPMSASRVMPGRHCSRGLRATTVSVMLRGAGSVDVSARAILATTMATSGTFWIASFCSRVMASAWGSEMAGSAMGMNIRSPSSSGGMNSRPKRGTRARAPARTRPAAPRVRTRWRSAQPSSGR